MTVKRNLIANGLGQAWVALMGLAFTPLYIKYMGVEAFGLIGIFAILQGWLTLLDFGMTPLLGREMARHMAGQRSGQSIRNLLRTIEIIAITLAILTALGIWAAANWLASDWLKAERLPISVVAHAFSVMGLVTALRFVENVYRSAVIGLQRQVLLNGIASAMATLRGLGAVVILAWVSPTVEAFFVWQALLSIVSWLLLLLVTYAALPRTNTSARFSFDELKGVWHFAAGVAGSSFLALLLTQVDKILLSRLLTLEAFGYYSLAIALSGALCFFSGPFGQAYFPVFTQLSSKKDEPSLSAAFHKSMQFLVVIMGPAAIMLMFFSAPILVLWTNDQVIAHEVAPLLKVLVLGTLLNGLMWLPYQLQLAHGWTSLSMRINACAVVILVPTIFWAVPKYGAMGVAWIWVALNLGNIIFGSYIMFQRLLTSERSTFYVRDMIKPLTYALIAASIFSWAMPLGLGRLELLLWLSSAFAATFVASLLGAPIALSVVRQFITGRNWL